MSGFTAALSSTIFRWKFAAAHFRALLFEDSFARQSNAIALDGQHFYQHLVAFFQFIANVLDAVLGDFADMQQTVGAGDDLDERAEIGQPRHRTEVGLADLGRGGQVADDLQGLGCRSLVVGGHVDFARVLDVDLYASALDDAANHLTAGPNHVANFVHRNLQGVNTRREGRNLLARSGQHRVHLAENKQTTALGLRQRFAHDLRRDASDLDVHLQGGDAV